MKKYLMTGIAAVAMCAAFTSCSKDVDFEQAAQDRVQSKYDQAFLNYIGGPIDPNQDWGFSATRGITRSGNTGETYPATHYYYANGQVIASANMNHNEWGNPNAEYGGWIVPDPLTEGQKLRVQKYFQANPNLDYEDPHYRHFFVQQVYTGGTDKTVTTGNKEVNVAADGTKKTGASLNQLTVGEANSHINDFNSGTCTPSNVLNHEGKTQSDQITLMLNVDDTSCFGYHETSGSNVNPTIQHNDKMALVSAATIDAWAAQNGNPGEAVTDKWNRSFMGFDYEMLPESNVIVPNTYAMLNQVQNINNCQYAVYNGTVMKIGQKPAGESKADLDITNNLIATSGDAKIEKKDGNLVWNGKYISVNVNANATGYAKLVIEYAEATPNNYNLSIGVEGGYINGYDQNRKSGETKVECDLVNVTKITNLTFMNGNANFKIKKVYLTTGANEEYYDSEYLLADTEKIPFYSTNTNMYGGQKITLTQNDFYTTVDGKTCLNLTRIKQLYDEGYRPLDTALWNWVKYEQVSDGYYSDWIVTLTEAKRQVVEQYDLKIIAEDLTAQGNSDFDFNDVVLEVKYGTQAKVKLTHAGGTLPLVIITDSSIPEIYDGNIDETYEVHDLFGVSRNQMVNTGAGPNKPEVLLHELTTNPLNVSITNAAEANTKLRLFVYKENKWYEMKSPKGEPACKLAVDTDYPVLGERVSIKGAYTLFVSWAEGSGNFTSKWWVNP